MIDVAKSPVLFKRSEHPFLRRRRNQKTALGCRVCEATLGIVSDKPALPSPMRCKREPLQG